MKADYMVAAVDDQLYADEDGSSANDSSAWDDSQDNSDDWSDSEDSDVWDE